MEKICVEAKIEQISIVTEQIDQKMEQAGFSEKKKALIAIAIDEIMSNIIYYSGSKIIEIEYAVSNTEVVISFADNGIFYNPLEAIAPDVTIPAAERKIGGLGIYMVKELMDEITYQNKNGKNILQIRKKC